MKGRCIVVLTALVAPLLAAALSACDRSSTELLTVEIVATYPHDPGAFTQGLELHGGRLYESTGNVGASSLREVDPTTGEVIRLRPLPAPYFAEGLTRVGEELWQLTWRNQVAFRWDLSTFEPRGSFAYLGEGWGLCSAGDELYMTDGSSRLQRRDPVSFELLGTVSVTDSAGEVALLNELECVDDVVYANVWQSDRIVRIDPASGRVSASIDAAPLRAALPVALPGAAPVDVLNGIAFDVDRGTFLLTGKYWPLLFEVRFVPVSR